MKKFLVSLVCLISMIAEAQEYKRFPFWDPSLPFEKRVDDLVGRLTLDEKVAQMLNATPAISRLGVPAYDWWSEILHGVARTPYHTTSFPQAIGMAATWDTASLHSMADYSAMEGRAVFQLAAAENKGGKRYMGLTYWTPNINIFRDPRWGRGQETYGEDPFLTAMLARSFVRGLQGEDPRYLKAAACAKHFAVHSGPEPTRHSDNVNPSPYDLWDTYLPAFRELVVNAGVAGVMCAYNAVNTQPCCANDLLMNDILRNKWKFAGYVTSDCWAVDDFFRYHKTHKDAISSAVDALIHGTDVECGNAVYKTLLTAVQTGLIKEQQLDISLKRLFMIRFRLGLFDPDSMVSYAKAPSTLLESPDHKAHALKMARQSIVLLKNANQILPLNKSIRTIAVIGPNADNRLTLLGNYNGIPSKVVTVLEGIRDKLDPGTKLIYEKAVDFASDTLMVYRDLRPLYSADGRKGVKAEYFENEKLEGNPVYVANEPDIDHFWNEGQSPYPGLPAFHYSARFTTWLQPEKDEVLNFEMEGDDGYRLFVNDSLRIDAWQRNSLGLKTCQLPVRKDSSYKIRVEFFQSEGNAVIRLRSGNYVKTDFAALNDRLKAADAIIFVGGISPQLEGEEMPVAVPGFSGGDRSSIRLPAVQTALMKSLVQTGKPVVFVMMTGSAIAASWEDENIPAIINAWYGGQAAGTAVADVLFGDYNPAGRLPVTFYASDNDLPDFGNYDMSNRTYRYFKGRPLYPFGYGLSYSRFHYDELSMPTSMERNKDLTLSVRVTNTGKRGGEEVVQLYISYPPSLHAPLRALKGFQRIFLKAGESRKLRFQLRPADLSLVDEKGELFQPAGKLRISIGGGQPGVERFTTSDVVTGAVTIK